MLLDRFSTSAAAWSINANFMFYTLSDIANVEHFDVLKGRLSRLLEFL